MGKNPSWIALLKQKNPLGKNKTDPKILEQQMNRWERENENGALEGKEPALQEISFAPYKWSTRYILTSKGIIKSLKWKPMKYIFAKNKLGPRVCIKKLVKRPENEGITWILWSQYSQIDEKIF